MFNQKRYYNLQQQHQPTILAKVNSSYRKLEKAMKEPPREYEQIKKLVEDTRGASNLRFDDASQARDARDRTDTNIININDIKKN